MVKFKTIIKAKDGDKEAVRQILNYFLDKAMAVSKDEDYLQNVGIEILKGINNFRNYR